MSSFISRHRTILLGQLLSIALLGKTAAHAQALPNCTTSCPTFETPAGSGNVKCRIGGCNESSLRDAIVGANACAGLGKTPTIEFDPSVCGTCPNTTSPFINCCGPSAVQGCGSGTYTCYIDMANTSSVGTCGTTDKALCLTGNDITLDGKDYLVLQWSGARGATGAVQKCREDPTQLVAPIRIRGQRNTVQRMAIQYFTDGLKLEQGDGHLVRGVINERICDDAFDVPGVKATPCPTPTPSNSSIYGCRLRGWTLADYQSGGFWCVDASNNAAPCGLGKGIQINGGTNITVTNTDLLSVRIPVRTCPAGTVDCGSLCPHGPHRITGSHVVGLPPGSGSSTCAYAVGTSNPTFCRNTDFSLAVAGGSFTEHCRNSTLGIQLGATGTLTTVDNTDISYSKWGIRVEANAQVAATSNTLKANYGAGIAVSDTGASLVAEDNLFVLNGCNANVQGVSGTPGSGGHVVVMKLGLGSEAPVGSRPASPSHLDLGGGDASRRSVLDGAFDCSTSNAGDPSYHSKCSFGGNKFCRDPNRIPAGVPDEEEVLNTTNSSIAASTGIGGGVTASCVGNVGASTNSPGRALAQSDVDPARATRCTNTILTGSTMAQSCAVDSAASCDCQSVFP